MDFDFLHVQEESQKMDFTAMIPSRIMFHPPQSYQLLQSEEFVTISGYNSKVSLPLKQIEMEWGAVIFSFHQL